MVAFIVRDSLHVVYHNKEFHACCEFVYVAFRVHAAQYDVGGAV